MVEFLLVVILALIVWLCVLNGVRQHTQQLLDDAYEDNAVLRSALIPFADQHKGVSGATATDFEVAYHVLNQRGR